MLDQIFTALFVYKVSVTTIKHELRYQEVQPIQETRVETPKVGNTSGTSSKALGNIQGLGQGQVGVSPAKEVAEATYKYFGVDADIVLNLYCRESHCGDPYAINPTSGACGLFQFLPCSKMACSLADIECQVKAGKAYIERRYGTAQQAYDFRIRNGWY